MRSRHRILLELGEGGHQRRDPLALRCTEIKRPAGLCDQRHPSRLQIVQGVDQIQRATAPPGQLRHQDRIELPRLRQGHHLVPLDAIVLHP